MTLFLKKHKLFISVLALATAIRVIFSFFYAHSDLITQIEWGSQAFASGSLKGFYESESLPNHPPLISALYYLLIPLHSQIMWLLSSLGNFIALHRLAPTKFLWLFNFAIWFGTKKYAVTPVLSGHILLLKLVMIVADLGIGIVIYHLCNKAKVSWKIPVITYYLLPFSWYLSSSWGQSDQLSFIFLIVALITIYQKRLSVLSPLLFAIAANLKPNAILLTPIFLYVWHVQKLSLKKLLIGGLAAIIFSLWTVSWFTKDNALIYAIIDLPQKLNTSGGLTNYNAFNFWYIFHPFSIAGATLDSTKYFLISAKTWGFILTLITTAISLTTIKAHKVNRLFAAIFISGFGSWLFMTGIHERYSFLAITPILFLSIYNRQYLKYFLIFSTIFTLNLFIAYWPWLSLSWVSQIFEANNYLFPRILSALNVIFYFVLTTKIIKNNQKPHP